MVSLPEVTAFFGWCTVINSVMLALMTVSMIFSGAARKVHSRLFSLSEETLQSQYFQILGFYKLAILVFNLVPYLALRLVA